jgi:hypothetical protein
MGIATNGPRDVEDLKHGLDLRPMTLALAPEFRRCAVYGLVGLVLIPVVAWSLRDLRAWPSPGTFLVPLAMHAVFGLGLVGVLRWRVHVDGRGIARRRLFGWRLYPWEAFEAGQVSEGEYSFTYLFPSGRPWDRKLSIAMLADDDRSRLAEIIRGLWVRPPAPELPPELAIRLARSREWQFRPDGITVVRRREESRYGWEDVRRLRIRRAERGRRDFAELELVLPDRTLTLHARQDFAAWSGVKGSPKPAPAIVVGLLREYVPADRILETALHEPPATMAEWEDRLEILERRGRDLDWGSRLIWSAGGAMAILLLTTRGLGWAFAILCGIEWGLYMAILRKIMRDHREAIRELESQAPGCSP